MQVSSELFKAYIEDTTTLINEMDTILKKRNSIGSLDSESVDALFRIFHTIKASSVVLNDSKTVDVSYKMENIMSYLRRFGTDSLPSAKVFSMLFKSEYFLRDQLGSLVAVRGNDSSVEFEGELKEFVDDIDFKDENPVDIMVSFEAFRPLFENVVLEMSADLGKYAKLYFAGDNLYVDRTLVTRLSGPLTQIIRNAMDHGIEDPELRVRRGKPAVGAITVTYGLENGVMFITIFNDGEKMNLKKILRKADSLNILKKPRDQYKPDEIAALIMERGFTTKDSIGKYSGRGVGMDIIKSTASDLGGKILINSGEENGFSITLTFPIDDKSQRAAIRERINIGEEK